MPYNRKDVERRVEELAAAGASVGEIEQKLVEEGMAGMLGTDTITRMVDRVRMAKDMLAPSALNRVMKFIGATMILAGIGGILVGCSDTELLANWEGRKSPVGCGLAAITVGLILFFKPESGME